MGGMHFRPCTWCLDLIFFPKISMYFHFQYDCWTLTFMMICASTVFKANNFVSFSEGAGIGLLCSESMPFFFKKRSLILSF